MAVSGDVTRALSSLGEMLAADGYALELNEEMGEVLVAEIRAGPEACADCLVPRDMMRAYVEAALRDGLGREPPTVRLVYPSEAAAP
jgi:hypothetical protein